MLIQEVWYHSDRDHGTALVDDVGHFLVLHPDDVLPVDLKKKENPIKQSNVNW